MSSKKIVLCIFLTVIFALLSPIAVYANDALTENYKCLSCHGKQGYVISSFLFNEDHFEKSIHKTYRCTTCHIEIKNVPHTKPVLGYELKKTIYKRCSACHEQVENEYKNSVHYGKVECSECHGTHEIQKIQEEESLVNRVNISNVCMKCHNGEVKHAYMESFHGKANHLGSKEAASCADCHGSHEILKADNPKSKVSKENIPETCGECHVTARENYAVGIEHWTLENKPGSAPMYWTFKFFIWLTIIVITLLFVHMEMELYRLLKQSKEGELDENTV